MKKILLSTQDEKPSGHPKEDNTINPTTMTKKSTEKTEQYT
jgi:hypothetical protein